MLNQWLNSKTITIKENVESWQKALAIVATPLIEQQLVSANYLDAIYLQHQRLGPYYVVAPKIAMPHARPEDGVMALGLSMLVIKDGCYFGSLDNDPVYLIVMLAAPDNSQHIELITHLAELFSSNESVDAIIAAADVRQIQTVIDKY